MNYTFKPKGVCSMQINIELDEDIIKRIEFIGGCSGNTQGVARLAEGRKIDEVIDVLSGIRCGFKTTSCPDQLAIALKQIQNKISA